MKNLYIEDLEKGMSVSSETFAVQESEKGTTKDGKPFYKLMLVDKTGTIAGQIWSDHFPSVELKALQPGNVVMVDASVEEFKGKLQLNIYKLTRVDEMVLAEYVEASEFDLDVLWKDMQKHVDGMKNTSLKELLNNIFSDKDLAARYKTSPAAEQIHHSFRGGLLEHVVEMLELSDVFRKFYKEPDYDLVTTGIVLHDIGKLFELKIVGMVVQKTTEGYLLGHLIKSFEFMTEKAKGILDDETLLNLKHIILAHHGQLEYGSPVMPSTIEAAIVHSVDMASSQVRIYQKVLRRGAKKEGDFTDYDVILRTRLYKKKNVSENTDNQQRLA
jgi:3'-5' exoribonuclease